MTAAADAEAVRAAWERLGRGRHVTGELEYQADLALVQAAAETAEAQCQWLSSLAPLFIALDKWIKVRKGLTAAGHPPTPTEMHVWDAYADVAFRLPSTPADAGARARGEEDATYHLRRVLETIGVCHELRGHDHLLWQQARDWLALLGPEGRRDPTKEER